MFLGIITYLDTVKGFNIDYSEISEQREIHMVEQGVRGYSVAPMLFFSQSTVFSKRGYG